MTDNEAIIKVAKWMGWKNCGKDDNPYFMRNGIMLPVGNSFTHQLLMLAVCFELGWETRQDLDRYWWIYDPHTGEEITTLVSKADLPLAVIRAAAERIEG